jgi:hypothetical protein
MKNPVNHLPPFQKNAILPPPSSAIGTNRETTSEKIDQLSLRILITKKEVLSSEEQRKILMHGNSETKQLLLKSYAHSLLAKNHLLPFTSSREARLNYIRSLKEYDGPLFRSSEEKKIKFFAHLLSDEWIAEERFKWGEKLEGFSTCYFKDYFLLSQEDLFEGISAKEELIKILENLDHIENYTSKSEPLSHQVEKNGGTLYFLAGWNGTSDIVRLEQYLNTIGHIIPGKIVKNDSDFSLYIFNTGAGLLFHPLNVDTQCPSYGIAWHHISCDILNASALEKIFKRTIEHYPNDPGDLYFLRNELTFYVNLWNYLASNNILGEPYGESLTHQRAGTCSKQCLDILFRDIVFNSPSTKKDEERLLTYKTIKTRQKIIALQDALEYIKEVGKHHRPLMEAIIREGINELSSSLQKRLKNLPHDESSFSKKLDLTTQTLIDALIHLEKDFLRYQLTQKKPTKYPIGHAETILINKKTAITSPHDLEYAHKPSPIQPMEKILLDFPDRISKEEVPSQKELEDYIDAIKRLLGRYLPDSFNPILFKLIEALHTLSMKEALQPATLSTALKRIVSLADVIKQAPYQHQPLEKRLLRTALYLLSAQLFNQLTKQKHSWLQPCQKDKKFPIWTPHLQWTKLLRHLSRALPQISGENLPIFSYEDLLAKRTISVSQCPEYRYTREEGELKELFLSLESFKDILPTSILSSRLEEENGFVRLSSKGSTVDNASIEPEAIYDKTTLMLFEKDQLKSSGLNQSLKPKQSLQMFLTGLRYNKNIPLHSDHLHLLESFSSEETRSLFLPTWVEIMTEINRGALTDPLVVEALKSTLYSRKQSDVAFLFSSMEEVCSCNTEVGYKFLEQIELGCLSGITTISRFSWEVLLAVVDAFYLQEEWNHPLFIRIQEMSKNFLQKSQLNFDRIITSSDSTQISTDFSILLFNRIIQNRTEIDSFNFSELLRIHHQWLLHVDKIELSTFEEKIKAISHFYIQEKWPLFSHEKQEEIVKHFIVLLYPKSDLLIEVLPDQPLPTANIYQSQSSSSKTLVGSYSPHSKKIFYSFPICSYYQTVVPTYMTDALKSLFGNFENVTLNYDKETHTFKLASDPMTSFSQWDTKEYKTMLVHYCYNGKTYSSSIEPSHTSYYMKNHEIKFIELISSLNSEDKIYAYWNDRKGQLVPKWHIKNQELIWIDSITSPELIGAIAGEPDAESSNFPLLKSILRRMPRFIDHICWFKENQLRGIEFPFGLLFQFKDGKIYLNYNNSSYLVSHLDLSDDFSNLLHPYAFKLISAIDQKEFWFGLKDPSRTNDGEVTLVRVSSAKDIKKFIERAEEKGGLFEKIRLKDGKLVPTTDEQLVYLIEKSLEKKLFSQALEWTKKLVLRGTFTPSEHLTVLNRFNWEAASLNPATYPTAKLLEGKITAQALALSATPGTPTSFIDEFQKFAASVRRNVSSRKTGKIPSSKLHYHHEIEGHRALASSVWIPIPRETSPTNLNLPFIHFTRRQYKKSDFYEQFEGLNENLEDALNALFFTTTVEFENSSEAESPYCGEEEKSFLSEKISNFLEKYRSSFTIPFFIYHKDGELQLCPIPANAGLIAKGLADFHNIPITLPEHRSSTIPYNQPQLLEPKDASLEAIGRAKPSYFTHEEVISRLKNLEASERLEDPPTPPLRQILVEIESSFLDMLQPLAQKALLSGATALHRNPMPLIETFYPLLLQRNKTQWLNQFPHFNLDTHAILELHTSLFSYLWVKTEILHQEKNQKRAYDMNSPLAPFFMLYEEMAELVLYPYQVESLSFLLEELQKSVFQASLPSTYRRMLQSIMGSGKSKVLVPLILLYLSTTHNSIPVLITTKPLLHSTYLELTQFLYDKFKLQIHLVKASRNMALEALQLLKDQLAEAKLGRAVLMASSESIHALNLLLPELSLSEKKTEPAYIQLAKEIVFELNNNGFLLVDECDTIFNPKELLSYPVGAPIRLDKSKYNPIVTLFFEDLIHFRRELGIATKNTHLHANPQLISSICKKIARRILQRARNPILQQWIALNPQTDSSKEGLAEDVAKLFSEKTLSKESKKILEKAIASTSSTELSDALQEIKMYQLLFGKEAQLLRALSAMHNAEYGLSLEDLLRHSVIPCSNGNPQENRQFDESLQILVKTCLYYLHGWDSLDRIKTAIKEGVSFLQKPLHSAEYPNLNAAFDFYKIDRVHPLTNIEKVAAQINEGLSCENPNATIARHARTIISFFLSQCVFPKELYQFLLRLSSTSSTILGSYKRVIALSGTLEASSSWMDQFQSRLDEQIIPKIRTKALSDPIALLSNSSSTLAEKLQELWNWTKAETRALIDVGGFFRGISPLMVAKEILKVAQTSASDHPLKQQVQGVLFYPLGKKGYEGLSLLLPNGQLVPLPSSSREDILSTAIEHGLLQREENFIGTFDPLQSLLLFTYYDQAHARGTDIAHHATAHALITYDPKCTLTDLQQGAMRMRGYLMGQSLTWIYTPVEPQTPLTMEKLLATAEKVAIEQQHVALAQSCLNDLSALGIKYLHLIQRSSDPSLDITPLKDFMLQKLDEPDYLNIQEPQRASHMDKLKEVNGRLEALQEKYRHTFLGEIIAEDYAQWLQKYTRLLKEKGDRGLLESLHFEGTVEVSLEQELEQEQVLSSCSIAFSDLPDNSSLALLSRPLLHSRKKWDTLSHEHLIGKSFWLTPLIPPNLLQASCSQGIALSSALFPDPKQSQFRRLMWEEQSITYTIKRVVLYSSGANPSQQLQAILTRGDEVLIPPSHLIANRIRRDYTLRGDCIFKEEIKGTFNKMNYLGYFTEKNIFEALPPHERAISLLCSAIIFSGDITVLNEPKSIRNQRFFTWLNQRGEACRTDRLSLFFQTYYQRPDRVHLGTYTKSEFEKLMKRLEQLSRVKE